MKTKLLKKLRKLAYKKIGMCTYINSDNQLYYKIIVRKDRASIDNFGDYGKAVKALKEYRRSYILMWVKEIRSEKISRDIEKL